MSQHIHANQSASLAARLRPLIGKATQWGSSTRFAVETAIDRSKTNQITWWEANGMIRRQLQQLTLLADNWDGDGALAVDLEIIEAARILLGSLPRKLRDDPELLPLVTPMRTGNLQFEWHRGPKILELEIETPSQIHFLRWSTVDRIENEGTCSIDDTLTIALLTRWFLEDL